MMTFDKLTNAWIQEKEEKLKNNELSSKTLRGYKDTVKHLLPYFKDIPVTDIDNAMVEEFKQQLEQKIVVYNGKEKHMSKASIDTVLNLLRIIMNYAVNNKYIYYNPTPNCKSTTKKETPLLTIKDIRHILSVAKKQAFLIPLNKKEKSTCYLHTAYYIALILTLLTGLPKKELFILKWNYLQNNTLTISENVLLMGENTAVRKSNIIKRIKLDKDTLSLLTHWKEYQSKTVTTPLIFSNAEGYILDPSNMTNRWWKKIRAVAGFPKLRWQDITKFKNSITPR